MRGHSILEVWPKDGGEIKHVRRGLIWTWFVRGKALYPADVPDEPALLEEPLLYGWLKEGCPCQFCKVARRHLEEV